MKRKSNEPKLTQKDISRPLGFSDSNNRRYRDDNKKGSPPNRKKYRKKNNESNTSVTQNQTLTTN